VSCPTNDTIAELVCRRLAEAKALEVEAHVADCSTCRRLVGTLSAGSLWGLGSEAITAVERDYAAPTSGERYVVQKELARGGMGRISIADDTLLGRTVAIKELLMPSAELAARFQRELALTARLQHPSIVSIHDGGTWSNGEPFYVMRLVSGEPLDRVIARHDAAGRIGLVPHGIAMVDAVAYAHSQGIVHRDLKPGNVLVGDFGETVVIDWGLARDLLAPAFDDDAGRIVGTPAYMAPEQARGDSAGERSDVYALGAVMYHLLAGAAPYSGRDVDAIVEAVRAGPPAPLRDVGSDLSAIVAKAMARDPADRYANAGELATDLKRFQSGQLVGARRYSSWQLVRRWVGRHRTAVAVGVVAAIVVAVVIAISFRRVLAEEAVAEQRRVDAEDLLSFMVTDLRDKLEPIGKLDLLRTVAAKARAYYDEHPGDRTPRARHQQLLAHANLGHVLQDTGDVAGASTEYRAALALADGLAGDEPANPEWAHEQSANHRRIGEMFEIRGDQAAALAERRSALAIAERVLAREPANATAASDRLQSKLDIGRALAAQGNLDAGLAEYRGALAIAEELRARQPTDPTRRREVYMCHSDLGIALVTKGDTTGALAEFRAAKTIANERVAQHPNDGEALRDLWETMLAIGKVLVQEGQPDAGLAELRAASEIAAKLVARDPSNTVWQRDLSNTDNEVGNVLLAQGDAKAALASFRAGQQIAEQLAARFPDNAEIANDIEVSASRVGTVLEAQGDLAAALVQYRNVLAVASRLAAADPSSTAFASDLAMAHNDLGSGLQSSGDVEGALAEFRAAVVVVEKLVAKDPTNAAMQRLLWAVKSNIADIVVAKDPDAAIIELRSALAIATKLAEQQSAEARGDLATAYTKLGDALARKGSTSEAREQYRNGLTIAEALAKQDPKSADFAKAADELRGKLR